MISANYTEFRSAEYGITMELEVKGHAGAGPAGQDIVCAAVSALAQTLGDRVEALAMQGGAYCFEKAYRREENSWIVVGSFLPEEESRARAWFEFVREGIAAIAAQYPERVELEEHILEGETE
ncbi:MAG: ribosomal-processing cysteine protease Prp [Oscillospiraceae bacterium]